MDRGKDGLATAGKGKKTDDHRETTSKICFLICCVFNLNHVAEKKNPLRDKKNGQK